MCHVADKFYAAVRALATDVPLKQRRICAYVDHLESLPEDDVPVYDGSICRALQRVAIQ